MLTGDLFEIKETNRLSENEFNIVFSCNPLHPIFKGHFPGSPVLPGVTMIQFVRETLNNVMVKKYSLYQARSIKFVNMIDPLKEKSLSINIKTASCEQDYIDVSAVIKSDTTNFFQFRGKYRE